MNSSSVPDLAATPARLEWLTCPECGARCRDRELPKRSALICRRCRTVVRKQSGGTTLQPAWAFAMAGLFFAILANVEPVLTFDVAGNTQTNHIVTGIFNLSGQGYWPVALLVLFAGIIGPILHLASVAYVSAACCLSLRWPGLRRLVGFAEAMESWNLVPVYAIATVVAAVKLDMLGKVEWQAGALWIVTVSVFSLLATQFFDRDLVERQVEDLS